MQGPETVSNKLSFMSALCPTDHNYGKRNLGPFSPVPTAPSTHVPAASGFCLDVFSSRWTSKPTHSTNSTKGSLEE